MMTLHLSEKGSIGRCYNFREDISHVLAGLAFLLVSSRRLKAPLQAYAAFRDPEWARGSWG
jgi:hypothetical protein